MSQKDPKVSVVMSVYNGEKYLREAVESILNQTFTDFEFIITDDGSTDGTPEILSSIRDTRVTVIKSEKRTGPGAARNRAFEQAQGNYIAIMDADDISLPERFSIQKDFLDQKANVGVVGTWMQNYEDGELGRIVSFPEQDLYIKWAMLEKCSIAHPTTMIRTSVLRQVSGYCEKISYAADYDLWRRLQPITKFHNLPNVLLLRRKHPNRIAIIKQNSQLKNSNMIRKLIHKELLKKEIHFDVSEKLSTWRNEKKDALIIAKYFDALFKAFIANNKNMSTSVRISINRDVAHKFYVLSRINPNKMMFFLIKSIYLDPNIPINFLKSKLKNFI